MSVFFLIHGGDYREPVDLVGPFSTYDEAVQEFWRSQVEAGVVAEGEIAPIDHYNASDVRIGKVDDGDPLHGDRADLPADVQELLKGEGL